MLETYKAKIHGDKIEWETDVPKILQNDKPLPKSNSNLQFTKTGTQLHKLKKSNMNSLNKKIKTQTALTLFLFLFGLANFTFAQTNKFDEKAEAVLKRAVEKLGGEKYLQVKSIVGRGKFSLLRDNTAIS